MLWRGLVFALLAASALLSSDPALAQTAAPAPLPRTGSLKTEIVPSLIVMNSRSASLQGQRLVLTGVAANSIVFADRPIRAAGHVLTKHLLEEWKDSESFGKVPPNATVSVLAGDGSSVEDAVVELKNPHLEGDNLSFDVRVLEGEIDNADGPATVFIDTVDLLTQPSNASAARRTARQAYWYGMSDDNSNFPPNSNPPYFPSSIYDNPVNTPFW